MQWVPRKLADIKKNESYSDFGIMKDKTFWHIHFFINLSYHYEMKSKRQPLQWQNTSSQGKKSSNLNSLLQRFCSLSNLGFEGINFGAPSVKRMQQQIVLDTEHFWSRS